MPSVGPFFLFDHRLLLTFCYIFCFLDEAKKRLKKEGYEQLSERDDWSLEAGKKYFFARNHSTIIAFAIGKRFFFGRRGRLLIFFIVCNAFRFFIVDTDIITTLLLTDLLLGMDFTSSELIPIAPV